MRQREGFHWFRRWRPTPQQERVLDALLEGKSNGEIAGELGISQDGAKWHVSQLLGETGLDDRYELAGWWREQRQRVEVRRGLVPVAGWLARAALIAPVALLAAWLVVADPLSIGNDSRTQASSPAPEALAPTAIPPPPPSPTPETAGAWIFDLRDRSVRPLRTANFHMSWLDEGLFLTQSGSRSIVIDEAGAVVRELPQGLGAVLAVEGRGEVVLIDSGTDAFSALNVATGESRPLVALGPAPPPLAQASIRTWAVSPDATMLAVGEANADGVHLDLMRLDGSVRRVVWSDAPDVWPAILTWSPDSKLLMFVSSQRRLEGGRLSQEPRQVVVIDQAGRVLVRRPISDFDVRWLGSGALYVGESGTNAPATRASAVIDMASGAESPGLPTRGLLCFSPDGGYAVYANTPFGRAAGHRVVAVATGEVVLENQTRTEVGACDWTSDSTRVVLSFGGK